MAGAPRLPARKPCRRAKRWAARSAPTSTLGPAIPFASGLGLFQLQKKNLLFTPFSGLGEAGKRLNGATSKTALLRNNRPAALALRTVFEAALN